MDARLILKQIGLTSNETSIYLKCVSLGSQPASIISRRVNINRGTTYSTLKTLISKGLITQSKKATGTYFTAKKPESLLQYLESKKNDLDRKKNILNEHLDVIQKQFTSYSSNKPQVTFYEGLEGINQIHEDILNLESGNTIYSFIPQDMVTGDMHDFVFSDFVSRRVANKIHAKIIAPESDTGYEIQTHDKESLRETKIVSKEYYNFESEITIYGKKIAMISYKEQEMIGLIVESPAMAKTLKQIFSLTWLSGKNFILNQKEMF